jgi:hypothetical protein
LPTQNHVALVVDRTVCDDVRVGDFGAVDGQWAGWSIRVLLFAEFLLDEEGVDVVLLGDSPADRADFVGGS